MMAGLKISVMVLISLDIQFFSHYDNALQIIAYFDELEICNPLGSHVKRHKVGIVFLYIGQQRSYL